ncbi:hypothetical protein BJ741DRAFT_589432 [Chytriomyces cf. hyalinus JEL632]|nr:hypothetical protein BJ741DRAFT_589432 [Chytriomyces cf. hyalinus JEL632]
MQQRLCSIIAILAAACIHTVTAQYNFKWAPATINAPAVVGFHVPGVPAWTQWFSTNNKDAGESPAENIQKCTSGGDNVWGASFDDGPTPYTPRLLEYFAAKKLKTTFWVVGYNVQANPDILRATYDAGHEIGIHTWSHTHLTQLSDDEIIAELVYGARAVFEVIGKYPKYFRPPYGDVDGRVRSLAAMVGLRSVIWSRDSQDWVYYANTTAINFIVPNNFKSWIDAGSKMDISLEHDFDPSTVSVGIKAMDMLLDAGYTLKPFGECIGETALYGNSILPKFFASGLFESKLAPVQTATELHGIPIAVITSTYRSEAAVKTSTKTSSVDAAVPFLTGFLAVFLLLA